MATKRTVELAYCYDDGSWQAENFVQIPANTPEEQVEAVAIQEMTSLLNAGGRPKDSPEIVRMLMYNSGENSVGENSVDETEIPERIRFNVTLEIDHHEKIFSREDAIDDFLATLGSLFQREPYGWGATVIAEID